MALEVAETLRGHAPGEAQRAALESLAPRLRAAGQGRIRDALDRRKWTGAPRQPTRRPPRSSCRRARIDAPRGIVSGSGLPAAFRGAQHGQHRRTSGAHDHRVSPRRARWDRAARGQGPGRGAGQAVHRAVVDALERVPVRPAHGPAVRRSSAIAGAEVALPLEVQGLPLPSFEFDWWVVDDPARVKRAPRRPKPRFPVDVPFEVKGNGDGVLQPGERVLIAFSARNVGGGAARDARAVLNNSVGHAGPARGGERPARPREGGRSGPGRVWVQRVGDGDARDARGARARRGGCAPAREHRHGIPAAGPGAPPGAGGPGRVAGRPGRRPRCGEPRGRDQREGSPVRGPPRGHPSAAGGGPGHGAAGAAEHGGLDRRGGPRKRRARLPRDLVETTDQRRLSRLEAPAMVQPPWVRSRARAREGLGDSVVLRGTVTHEIGVADLTVSVEPTEPSTAPSQGRLSRGHLRRARWPRSRGGRAAGGHPHARQAGAT